MDARTERLIARLHELLSCSGAAQWATLIEEAAYTAAECAHADYKLGDASKGEVELRGLLVDALQIDA